MPILLDLSQIAISNLMMSPNIRSGSVEPALIKHMVLTSIKGHKQNFGNKYGQVVVCCDSKHYWRRDIFPHYKAKRKANRDKSKFDWKEVFQTLSDLKAELREVFPYKVIEVYGAEADDVIATIAKHEQSPVLIVGSDKDYCQLQVRENVHQYSPTTKKFIKIENPKEFLTELIISGDGSDGIPNIKSDSDTFVHDQKRQSPIKTKDIEVWKKLEPEKFCESKKMLENFKRNKELIDFAHIPENLVADILKAYEVLPKGNQSKIMNYLIDNKMRILMKDIADF
jgi:bifunctional DNA-binding transcriptional regulator/antitoxin component of YhaV-PrlF toxin-antitoxin module